MLKKILIGAGALVALSVIVTSCSDEGENTVSAPTVTVTETVTVTAEPEREVVTETVTETATETVTATPSPEPAEDPSPEPAEEGADSGEYTAGDFSFADVQITEDFAGDFEARARVTYNGSGADSAGFTVTLFSDGSMVGTLDGYVDDLDSGETVTVEFWGVDPYTSWDTVEFQVDYAW